MCALPAQKDNHILGSIKRSVGNRLREVILLLNCSLVNIQLWSPQEKTDMNLFKQVQRRATKIFLLL